MSINANYLVALPPHTITGGSSDLQTNGLVLTESELLPADKPAVSYVSASAVSAVFGAESDEAKFAQQYFTGLTNQQKAPNALIIARRISADAAAWIRSAPLTVTLANLKKVTDGAIKITVGADEISATGIDFSDIASFSDAANVLAAKVTGTVGSYNSDTGAITLTTEATGDGAVITYATASSEGTDIAALLGFTKDAGAVISQGVDAMTISENMDAICGVTRNWTQFTTIKEVTDEADAKAYAAWADTDDDYAYVFWSSDTKMCDQLTQESTVASKLTGYNTTICVFCEDYLTAATVVAYPATIKWDANQGMKVLFGKTASNISAAVTDETVASNLDSLKVTYCGEFATRNAEFSFFNRGAMMGTMYGFFDAFIGMAWLRSCIQRSCMDGFASVNRVPYNQRGYAMIDAWISDCIISAKNVGVIDEGVSLSESQKAQITQEVGEDISKDLFSNGYWFGIEDPASNVRAERGTPQMYFYFCYGGSIQKIEMPVTAVL